jgi:hypothetical protein
MAHFAELNDQNVVLRVIVISDNDCDNLSFPESEIVGAAFCRALLGGRWKQTSFNGRFRRRYAGIGFQYNVDADVFIAPQPDLSWILNPETFDWEPPAPIDA